MLSDRAGVPVTTLAESPATKPVMVAVRAGAAEPDGMDRLTGVTVKVAGCTVKLTCTGAAAARPELPAWSASTTTVPMPVRVRLVRLALRKAGPLITV